MCMAEMPTEVCRTAHSPPPIWGGNLDAMAAEGRSPGGRNGWKFSGEERARSERIKNNGVLTAMGNN